MWDLRQWWRSLVILLYIIRFALRLEVCQHGPWWLRCLCFLNPYNWFPQRSTRASLLRELLERLGPLFIKFGQQLSTRRDLLPQDIADQMSLLQDKVPPFSSHKAKLAIEKSLAAPIDQLFADFSLQPLASASIAQVHSAQLFDGREVVVKVLRPKILRLVKRDIRLMYLVAKIANKFVANPSRLRLISVVGEFENTTLDELDMQREAANAATLRRNFADSDLLYVPEIYWPYVRREVLVQERIYGIPISQIQRLKDVGVDLQKLAATGVEIFFTQVFRDSFFHADMHPGNILVGLSRGVKPKSGDFSITETPGQYVGVDFGIMGSLTPYDQYYIAENLLAFFNRDYRQVAELHIDSGWVDADTRIDRFEGAIRAVCEPIFEQPLDKISFAQVLLRLFQTASQFNMTVQPQLILLQKTLLNVEGLGRELYPQLNLWDTAKPHLERFVRAKRGALATTKQITRRLPKAVDSASQIPELALQLLQQVRMSMQHGSCSSSCASVSAAGATKGFAYRGGWRWLFGGAGAMLSLATLFYRHHYKSLTSTVVSGEQWLQSLIVHHGLVVGLALVVLAWLWPRKV